MSLKKGRLFSKIPAAVALKPKDSLTQAASLMRQERIGAIPIVENGVLRGIITRSDILDAFLKIS